MANWQNRILRYAEVPANQLLANPDNPRSHPMKQVQALQGSLETLGWYDVVIVNERTGYLIDGHARVEEALSKDERMKVPVLYVDLSEAEEALALATHDYMTYLAEYEPEILEGLLGKIDTSNPHLQGLLSDLGSANGILFDTSAQQEIRDVSDLLDNSQELLEKWGVKTGDTWLIGIHELLCGDSTDKAVYGQRLEFFDLVFTDPPYEIGSKEGGGFYKKEVSQRFKDKLKPMTQFNPQGLIDSLAHLSWSSAIIFSSKALLPEYLQWAKNFDFNLFVWHKTNALPMTHHTFLADLEYMVVAHKPSKVFTNGLDYQDYSRFYQSPLSEGRDGAIGSHPTMKPLALIKRYVQVLSHPKGYVFDGFGGSGTTMVACEELGRACRMIEIDPAYCAVILERLSLYGLSPEKVSL